MLDSVRTAPPNVVTLVRICGGVVSVRRVGDRVVVRRCPQPAPKLAPRGDAQVVRLGLPAAAGR